MSALVLLTATTAADAQDRWFDEQHAAVGRPLYLQHCAGCHGHRAEGATQWHKPGADGRFPPPPLNGTGHAWHHPLKSLYGTIVNGQGNMPAWGSKLDTAQVLAIIAWFQSQWPDEIYTAWARMDRRSR